MALVGTCRVYPEWLAQRAGEITLLRSSSAVHELLRSGGLAGGAVVWSMWPGYLGEPTGKRLQNSLDAAGVPFVLDHSSGHASTADLTRLMTTLEPSVVVPIHTESPERHRELSTSVAPHPDGEWWSM